MSEQGEPQARVVVVDDSRLIREIVRDALSDHVAVECCADGPAALEALEREAAELVISDLEMPGMSGIELLERVRRVQPGTDFILLTGNATVESAVGALRMGAADYLTKPIQPDALLAVVERILTQRAVIAENGRLRDMLTTLESCRTLMRCLDASELYAVALDLLLHSLDRDHGLALFRRGEIPLSDGIAFRGYAESDANRIREVVIGEKPVNFDTVTEVGVVEESELHAAMRSVGIEAGPMLLVPLHGREREAGLLAIDSEGREFTPAEVERARTVTAHAQLALANAERYNHAKERAFIDDVTNAYNARYLLQATEHEIRRAERYHRKLSVLFLDLDHFKLVNDNFGHLVGSQVLRQLSEVLTGCIRQVDTLARYGGDEFTILLTDTDHEVGMTVAERIRATVAETRFEGDRGDAIHLEISIGVATCPDHSEQRDTLLDTADKAMYLAKARGRNVVCSASSLTE